MKNQFQLFLTFLFLLPNFVFSNTNSNNEIPCYLFHASIGRVLTPSSSSKFLSTKIFRFSPGAASGGLDLEGGTTATADNRTVFLAPGIRFQNKIVGITLGVAFISVTKGEGPDRLLLPKLGFRFGLLNEFFFSMGIFTDWAHPLFCKLNCLLKDSVSGISVGLDFGFDDEYSRCFLQFNQRISRQFAFSAELNSYLTDAKPGFRFGIQLLII